MRRQLLHLVWVGFGWVYASSWVFAADNTPKAQEIIAKSDSVRNPSEAFQFNIQLTEYVSGSPRNEMTLSVSSKPDSTSGQFRNVVRFVEPPRDAGKAVLLNGTTMWFYDPSSKTSVRISPQARLIGQASEGDVVTVNFARDYAATLIGGAAGETITDADHKSKSCWHIDLKPVHDDAVYGRVEYWVEKDTFRPVKGKFYSDSGRLLKMAYYHKYEQQLGALRPTETIIIDAVDTKLVTTMNFRSYRVREIPESWFQRDYLPRLN